MRGSIPARNSRIEPTHLRRGKRRAITCCRGETVALVWTRYPIELVLMRLVEALLDHPQLPINECFVGVAKRFIKPG